MKAGNATFVRTPDGTAIGGRVSASNYYVTDHLGSVIGIFNSSGTYLGGYSYSPYGEARATGTNAIVTGNILRYIGGELDGSGMFKLGARYYDASLGRFTQTDPSGQEENPYLYSSANPANLADPTGLYGFRAEVGGLLAAAPASMLGWALAGVLSGGAGIAAGLAFGAVAGAIYGGVSSSLGGANKRTVFRETLTGGLYGGLGVGPRNPE